MPKLRWLTRYELAFAVSEAHRQAGAVRARDPRAAVLGRVQTWESVPEEIDQVSRESAELALDNARRRDA